MGKGPFGGAAKGSHRLGRQQATGTTRRSGAGKKGYDPKHAKPTGKEARDAARAARDDADDMRN